MMRLKLCACLCVVSLLSNSCKHTDQKYDKPYFDFDSLINAQIRSGKHNDSIRKAASIDGREGRSSFLADSAQLAHEWDVFRQLDVMNKPAYSGHYKVVQEKDANSNLLVKRFTCDIPSSVPEVRFYFQPDLVYLKRIEARYVERNALYYTTRDLTLSFQKENEKILIDQYEVNGIQKMILSDSIQFSIRASISR